MLKILLIVLSAVTCRAAANSPLEADFPANYWDKETVFYGNAVTTYNISLAVKEPASLRSQVEAICKTANAALVGFSDQTPSLAVALPYARTSPEYAVMSRNRVAYSLTYKLPVPKAEELARQLLKLGRLISYTTNTPYGNPQTRELEDKIQWIEREEKDSATALKTMPVSRALLDAKLKALKQTNDSIKASEGIGTVTVQLLLDDAENPEDSPAPEHKQKSKRK